MLQPIPLQPGIYTEASPRANLNRWQDGSNFRFFKGNGQKVGGCITQIEALFHGVCRSMISWTTLSYERLIGLGTNAKLYLSDSFTYFDITPTDPTKPPGVLGNDPFTTTLGQNVIVVHHVANGRIIGDYVNFTGAAAFNGVNMNGDFYVDAIIDDDNYTVTASTNAIAAGAGGGAAVDFIYDIHSGPVDSLIGTGWGAGGWGTGTWGDPRLSNILTLARIWNLATWGEDLIASPVDGPIYKWVAAGGTNTRAVIISAAPAQNRKVLVSDQLRILISFGSHDGTTADPMLIRWSDSEDYNDWTPTPTNLAGDKRLDGANQIITAVITRDEIAVYTDRTLWSMYLTGDDLVFGFTSKGETTGLMGPNAAVDVDGVTYAMGRTQFYTYDGAIKILPCDVHSRIFGDINLQQAAKVVVARNKGKEEIVIFWPSANSQEIDRCAGYNYADGNWWLGTIDRGAWVDDSPFFDVPVATRAMTDALSNPAGKMYLQEVGADDDGAALPYFAQSYDMEISAINNLISGTVTGAGELVARITSVIPDFVRIAGRHMMNLKFRKYPQDRQFTKGPYPFYPGKKKIDCDARGRQMNIRISSNVIGADLEIGAWRMDTREQGNR